MDSVLLHGCSPLRGESKKQCLTCCFKLCLTCYLGPSEGHTVPSNRKGGVIMTNSENPLRTVREVAEALGVCDKTVYRMIADGQLKAVRIRNAWRISADELGRVVAHEG